MLCRDKAAQSEWQLSIQVEVNTPFLWCPSHMQPTSNNVHVVRWVSALCLCSENNDAQTKYGALKHIMHTRWNICHC